MKTLQANGFGVSGTTGRHHDPVWHPIVADLSHLLFGHSRLQSAGD
jgi:hypothetical protein